MSRSITPILESNQWATIIEFIGINRAIKSYLIFIDKSSKNHIFLRTEELSNIIWAFSFKGWTDNGLAINWLRYLFVLKTLKQDKHSILILNNHGSHIIGEFQYYCLKNNIHSLYLPSHASHKLQPLNYGPFSPLSAAYGR
jgi:DDE superfamily endonuclease